MMTRSTHPGKAVPDKALAPHAAPSRFWLLVLGGIGALALQAWLESPEEMMWFGLPMFVLVAGGYRLLRSMPVEGGAAETSPPAGPLRRTLVIALVVLLVAGFAVIAWERFNDSGFVGWLDAVQMRHGGRYREKTSFVAAMCDLLGAFGVGMWAVLRFGRKP
jgi:hypothetical protein